jgi:type IV fimbrial biogenesis protein FimT
MLSVRLRLRRRGFSMIEIAITIALISILLFAVMPEVTTMVANARIRSAAESYLQGLSRARNEALRTNNVVTFWLTSPNASGVLDNTCALSSSATAWVVSVNDPTSLCATAPSAASAPLITEKSSGASTGSNVTVSARRPDGTAATAVAFDGFGRVSGANPIRTLCLKYSTTSNNFRPLQIEVPQGGIVRLCEPRIPFGSTTDPRVCQILPPASCS